MTWPLEHGLYVVLMHDLGGTVVDVLFPDARPPHVGSIDVDLVLRLNRPGYERLVTILRNRGFRQRERV